MKGFSRKEKEFMGMGNSVVIVGSGSIRGINGNGKYTIKKIKSNEKMFSGEDTKKKKKNNPLPNLRS